MFTTLQIMRTQGWAWHTCIHKSTMSSASASVDAATATGAANLTARKRLTPCKELTPCRKLKKKLDEGSKDECITLEKWEPSGAPTSQQFPGEDLTGRRCGAAFFDCPCEELAKKLLGCALFRVVDGDSCWGRVVETEAYLGREDKAAHSYDGKRTQRNDESWHCVCLFHIWNAPLRQHFQPRRRGSSADQGIGTAWGCGEHEGEKERGEEGKGS